MEIGERLKEARNRADDICWSLKTAGQISGGAMEWFPAGSFDGDPKRLNRATIPGTGGTVGIKPEWLAESLTLYERRGEGEILRTLLPTETGGFALEIQGTPGQTAVCRIPWEDGDYWFAVEFE